MVKTDELMMKFSRFLSLGLIFLAFSAGSLNAQTGSVTVQGEWEADFFNRGDHVYMQLRTESRRGSYGQNGFTLDFDEFTSLDEDLLDSDRRADIEFSLVREAGTIAFEGVVRRGDGWGDFVFTPSEVFIREMSDLGYDRLRDGDVYQMALHDVNAAFVTGLRDLGYNRISRRRLMNLAIHDVTPEFIGEIQQVPPVYSAIKVDGARAYHLARDGKPADLPARTVRIDDLKILQALDADRIRLAMRCGKGAYVRALARDLGRKLGCYGYVIELRRSAVGSFDESNAISLDKLQELGHKGALADALRPVETALADIPALAVTGNEAHRLKCGQSLRVPSRKQGVVYVTSKDCLIAIANIDAGEVRPVRVFNL